MEIRVYVKLPVYAVDIRNEVFVKEQGFREEFDGFDKNALHLVGFIDDRNAATCRILSKDEKSYLIGRIAVRKKYRGNGFGSEIIRAAEKIIAAAGGKSVYIHAQKQAIGFYEKLGYFPVGEPDEEEGCPHQMLFKEI